MASLLTAAIGSFLISATFGILYNIQSPGLLALAGAVGSAGSVAYQFIVNIGGGEPAASFVGAIVFSLGSMLCARLTGQPMTTFQAPALIPLVPGGDIYRAMSALLLDKTGEAWGWTVTAVSVAGMLLMGMMLVTSVPYSFKQLKKLSQSQRNRWHF